MKVLVLGHHGMLGNAVHKFFKKRGYDVLTTEERWSDSSFIKEVRDSGADFIINCIGAIPQKYGSDKMYSLNVRLPVFLDKIGVPVIYPSTDCEFSGDLIAPLKYKKTDHKDVSKGDAYGYTKATTSLLAVSAFHNTKVIRTSIIGHEESSSKSLLDWFLRYEGDYVRGYDNAYWNGITTLQWAIIAEGIVLSWEHYDIITQVGTEGLSKYQLLCVMRDVYEKDIEIDRVLIEKPVNKMLESDIVVPDIRDQLITLRMFYDK